MTILKQLKVIVASTTDVKIELDALYKIIERINRTSAEDLGLVLKVMWWDTDSYSYFHVDGSPDLVYSTSRIEDCDIFIYIFWTRLGATTKDGEQGIEYEFNKISKLWKQKKKPLILTYFNQKHYFPINIKETQQQKYVSEFKKTLQKESLLWNYNGLEQFKELVYDHLTKYLQHSGIKDNESLTTIDNESNKEKLENEINENPINKEVPLQNDFPTSIDLLNRKVFAEALATKLNVVWESNMNNGAFIINVDGPWGSGKTSFLNLLRIQLEKSKEATSIDHKDSQSLVQSNTNIESDTKQKNSKWIVIEFNAWQHHRLEKSWWLLMDTICKEIPNKLWKYGFKTKAAFIKFFDIFWRIRTGKWSTVLFILTFILFFLGLGFLSGAFDTNTSTLDTNSNNNFNSPFYSFLEKNVGAIVTMISSLITGIYGIKNSLFPGSEKDVKNVLYSIDGPIEKIKGHFNSIIDKTKEHPIIVFIDDLDRCKEDYVVEFIESIQTLFKEKNIIFVISADKRWLYSSYEKTYSTFNATISEPGKPLRYLFLDKVFQLTVSIPPIDPDLQKIYWSQLLTKSLDQLHQSLEDAVNKAREKFVGKKTEKDIQDTLKNTSYNVIDNIALHSAAVLQYSNAIVTKDIQHKLRHFAPLIDANPRFMKKVANTYELLRTTEIMRSSNKVDFEQLALWVILSLKWPMLAEYLEKNPEKIAYIGTDNDISDIPDDLKILFKDKEVKEVVICKNLPNVKPTTIDEKTIREITGR